MKKNILLTSILFIEFALLAALSLTGSSILAAPSPVKASISEPPIQNIMPDKNDSASTSPIEIDHNVFLMGKYENQVPKQWSETATGVKTKLDTDE